MRPGRRKVPLLAAFVFWFTADWHGEKRAARLLLPEEGLMLGCSALGVCLVLLSAPADPGKQKTAPERPARLDQYGDPLPEGAVARIGTVRLRHAGPVSALAYSHDGKILASGSEDGTIRLWDAATGKELQCLAREQGMVAEVHFSADGQRLISWSDWQGYFSPVRVWDLRTGKAIGSRGGLARHPAEP